LIDWHRFNNKYSAIFVKREFDLSFTGATNVTLSELCHHCNATQIEAVEKKHIENWLDEIVSQVEEEPLDSVGLPRGGMLMQQSGLRVIDIAFVNMKV